MSDDDNNVFRFGAVQGGKAAKEEEEKRIPENDYVVVDIDDQEWFASGFLIFTPHHLAIMRDTGEGAVPVLVLPILRVKASELVEPEFDEDEPSLFNGA